MVVVLIGHEFSNVFYRFMAVYFAAFMAGYLLIFKKFRLTGIPKVLIFISVRTILLICAAYFLLKLVFFDLFSRMNVLLIVFERQEHASTLGESAVDIFFYSFSFLIYTLKFENLRAIKALPIILVILNEAIAASRAVIIVCLLFMLSVNIIQQSGRVKIGLALRTVLLLLGLFLLIGYFRGSFDGQNIFDVLILYAVGGLVAFDQVLREGVIVETSFNLMPAVAKIISGGGDNSSVNNFAYTAIQTPVFTNIYTAFREVYNDFGQGFKMIFFALLHGCFTRCVDLYAFRTNLNSSDVAPFGILTVFNLYFLFYPIFLFSFLLVPLVVCIFIRLRPSSSKTLYTRLP